MEGRSKNKNEGGGGGGGGPFQIKFGDTKDT